MGMAVVGRDSAGGYFASRTAEARKLFKIIPMNHDRGVGLVYSSVMGAWAFLATAALTDMLARFALAVAVAALFLLEFERLNRARRGGSGPRSSTSTAKTWRPKPSDASTKPRAKELKASYA
jgi:hypothetical protein